MTPDKQTYPEERREADIAERLASYLDTTGAALSMGYAGEDGE